MIRRANADDDLRLRDLAALDSALPPDLAALLAGDVLVAEVDGEVWAARSLAAGTTISDPFRSAGHARELLELRATALHRAERGRFVARLARGVLRRSASAV